MEDPAGILLAGDVSSPPFPQPPSPAHLLHSVAASLLSLFPSPSPSSSRKNNHPLKPNPNHNPPEPSTSSMILPFPCNTHRSLPRRHGRSSTPFPSLVKARIEWFDCGGDGGGGGAAAGAGVGGGPAFVGEVFSMCDPLGSGLIAVGKKNFDIPFLSNRMPDWVKNIFKFDKRENPGAIFHFFVDLNDAVAYVRDLKIPLGTVGACRLHSAFEHYKKHPHRFKFVPNAKQVKEANKLLKANWRNGRRKLDGVPVFSAQNLNTAIVTKDGIKWYTPYFFDKRLLDDILEGSVDQYFETLIHARHSQRRHDSFGDDMNEGFSDSIFEPPEVDEVAEEAVEEMVNEMDFPEIPLNVMSKVAEIQFLDVVDRVLLGNRWLRKATGIQPKFPYLVDSFEGRSEASILKAKGLIISDPDSNSSKFSLELPSRSWEMDVKESKRGVQASSGTNEGFKLPFWDWFPNPWLKPPRVSESCQPAERIGADGDSGCMHQQLAANPFLPKVTMVAISSDKVGIASKASLKKTMSKLTQEIEQNDVAVPSFDDKDPLFVANLGDYPTVRRSSAV